jgi:hypothetical protein
MLDAETIINCPLPTNSTPKEYAFAVSNETIFRDGSKRRVFFNGTIARFSPNNVF